MVPSALRLWNGLNTIWKVAAILGLGFVLAVVIWLAGPLFYRTTVNEAFPTTNLAATDAPLVSGSFTQVDSLHAGEGTAAIYRGEDGALLLRLENFSVTNGPDLFVALSGHPAPRSSAEAHSDGYLEVDRLKASQGGQNYSLPTDLDLSQYRSVLIYCRAFSVVFSTAELQ